MTVLAHPGRTAGGLTATGQLVKLAVRRDRIALPAVVYVIAVLVAGTAETFKRLYPTAAGRAALAATGAANPALRFLYSRIYGDSLGSLTTWRYGMWAGIFAALAAIFVVIRHTRSDEESGPAGAGRLGRRGPPGGAGRRAGHLGRGQRRGDGPAVRAAAADRPARGRLGPARAGHRLLRAGLRRDRRVAAQLTSSARTARGIALGALGVAFVLRGVGDAVGPGGPSWLSWLSPLGWIQFTQPFAARDWWVLSLPLAVAAAGTGLAFELAARRDHGSGLLPDRPGPPAASAALRGPFGLAWRLQRGALAGWAVGYAFTFAACGAAAKGIGQLFGTSTALQHEFTRLGGQTAITNAYLAALMLLAGLVAAAFAISTVLRLRTEETGGRLRRCWPPRPDGSAGRSARSPSRWAAPRRCWPSPGWRPVSATACGPGRRVPRRRG